VRAAVLTGPGSVEMVAAAPAPLVPGSVRVAVEGSGVCGSNLPVWEGRPWFDYPLPPGNPGHEAWGRVVEGPGEGHRVALLGENAFADELVLPADRVVPLPPELDGQPFPGEAIGCAFNAARRSDFRPVRRSPSWASASSVRCSWRWPPRRVRA
jgi:NADPH2:quinone reductase